MIICDTARSISMVEGEVMNMGENIFGTIKGQIITPEILDEYSLRFEQDWQDSEVIVKPTRYGKALNFLMEID